MRSTFLVMIFFFVSLLFSGLLTMIAKTLGDYFLKARTTREGLPSWQNSSDTFSRGLLKLQKTNHKIYHKTNIYRSTVPQTHWSHIVNLLNKLSKLFLWYVKFSHFILQKHFSACAIQYFMCHRRANSFFRYS